MGKHFTKYRIKTKIIIIYIILLLLSFLLVFGTVSTINRKYMESEIANAGIQTVSALGGNLKLIFENVTQFSDLIYFDDHVQDSLEKIESGNINPVIQRTITKSLVNMILSGDYISSVFVFDKFNNYYNSNKIGPILVDSLLFTAAARVKYLAACCVFVFSLLKIDFLQEIFLCI